MLIVEAIMRLHCAYFVQEKPIKEICWELGLSRKVVRKVSGLRPRSSAIVIAQVVGSAGVSSTAKLPSTRSRMAVQVDWPCK